MTQTLALKSRLDLIRVCVGRMWPSATAPEILYKTYVVVLLVQPYRTICDVAQDCVVENVAALDDY